MKHLPFTENMKVADVVHINYQLLPILGRFGIMPGFENKTINEACSEKQIEASFFLEIINSYHNIDYFAESHFLEYSPLLIIDYLKKTHRYYVDVKIPELDEMVERFIENSSIQNKEKNKIIANFYNEYKIELKRHLTDEELTLFPYTIELEKAIKNNSTSPGTIEKIKRKEVVGHEDDHHQLEEKLLDLKNLLIKYLPPSVRNDLREKFLIELFRLEEDLNDHSRIEDKVLMPKILQMEQKILSSDVL